MVQERQFARRASGLIRGLSLTDAFLTGLMNQGLTVGVWVAISLGLSVYTGGNLVIAGLLSLILAGIGMPLVWGILGGSMPRSGGEYIYNSRILHPLVGIAESFSNAFIWLMWVVILAPWTMSPGMVTVFNMLGMPEAAAWCGSTTGVILGATLVNLLAFAVMAFGVKLFARVQKVVMVVAMTGALAVLLVFAFTPRETFVHNWDTMQASYAEEGTVTVDLSGIDFSDPAAAASQVKAQLVGRVAAEDLRAPQSGTIFLASGQTIDETTAGAIASLQQAGALENPQVKVKPLDYEHFLIAAGEAMAAGGKTLPSTWNWLDTFGVMVAASWLFVGSYCITYVAGEVKRPEKSILLGNVFAILVPVLYLVSMAAFLYNTVGFQFLTATAWVDQTGTALAGYTLPWSPSYLGLAGVITQSPVLIFLMAFSFVLFNLWYVALSYLVFPRTLFAWGMDRMGPSWMSDLNPRTATPLKNFLLCLILGEVGIVLYAYFRQIMGGLTVTTLQVLTVFGTTAVSALLFPFLGKVRQIWLASPYRAWKFLNIPAITWGAVFYLIYLAIIVIFYQFMPGFEKLTTGSLILFAGIWAFGILWYFYWKWRNRRLGIDVTVTYGELPPD